MNALRTLQMAGYRNLGDAVLELPPEGVALVGENAQGKTNLLEAVYYLETLRSFRGSRDAQLVRFEGDVFRLAGTLERPEGGAHTISAAYQKGTKLKRVKVDGVEVERLTDGIGEVAAVLFTPDDVRMVSDGPPERRRFLDIVLSLNRPGYVDALQRFRQVLLQRNRALREQASAATVEAWNPLLVRWATPILRERAAWVEGGAERFRTLYTAIAGGGEARLSYLPGVAEMSAGLSDTEIGDGIREALGRAAEGERKRGTTLVGPHRDEFRIEVESPGGAKDVRDFGSGGQRRSAALALRLLEAETVREARGREPILLMDDVFAELDEGRSERVLALLDRTAVGQVLLTAPKESDLRFRKGALPRWRIRGGVVEG